MTVAGQRGLPLGLLLSLLGVGCSSDRIPDTTTGPGGSSQAGGQTSEFGGAGPPPCPEKKVTSVDIASTKLASWIAALEGEHELPLGWQLESPPDTITGFDEVTTLNLDVKVVAAKQIEFSSAGSTNPELAYCDDLHVRALELELGLKTADGSLDGTLRHWVEGEWLGASPPAVPERLSNAIWTSMNGRYSLSEFSSSLEFGADFANRGRSAAFGLYLGFGSSGFGGSIILDLGSLGSDGGGGDVRLEPLVGAFPPHEGSACETALDDALEGAEVTPRDLFEQYGAWLERQPIRAAWRASGSRELASTELGFDIGEPTHACQQGEDSVTIEAPLRLETADGKLKLDTSVAMLLHRTRRAWDATIWTLRSPWIAAQDFERATGIQDAELGDVRWLGFELHADMDRVDDWLEGSFGLVVWDGTGSRPFDGYPTLEWCRGTGCEQFWCMLTAGSPDRVQEECPGAGGALGRG